MIRMISWLIFVWFSCVSTLFATTNVTSSAIDLTRKSACALDGMILMDYSGPKAQILWKDGKRTYYCDTTEGFSVWLDPIQQERIKAFYVQNYDNAPWDAYKGRWVDAKDPWYVINSKKLGAMGVSYIPFLQKKDAISFQKKYGGKLLQFKQITATVLANTEKLSREQPSMYGPQHKKMH